MPSIFRKELFQFLVELKFNNDRAWFQANKPRYERDVKQPMQALIAGLAAPLKRINPKLTCDPRRSMFRIYRDTRFSRDKTPYKTHASARFTHRASPWLTGPGFYLHLEPGECFCGAGIWMPDPPALKSIRKAILSRPKAWAPLSRLPYWGESFKRLPKDVPPGHKYLADLSRKHFFTWVDLKESQVLAPGFPALVARHFKAMNPLVNFLCSALGLK